MKKIIAIDFDGVLFTEAYPAVGMPIAPNINRAKNERANGAVLILWTCREGKELADAVAACKAVGLERERRGAERSVWNGPAQDRGNGILGRQKCVHGALWEGVKGREREKRTVHCVGKAALPGQRGESHDEKEGNKNHNGRDLLWQQEMGRGRVRLCEATYNRKPKQCRCVLPRYVLYLQHNK